MTERQTFEFAHQIFVVAFFCVADVSQSVVILIRFVILSEFAETAFVADNKTLVLPSEIVAEKFPVVFERDFE